MAARQLFYDRARFLETGDIADSREDCQSTPLSILRNIKTKSTGRLRTSHTRHGSTFMPVSIPRPLKSIGKSGGIVRMMRWRKCLYLICDLELRGHGVAETAEEREVVQMIVDYLIRV
jgi:hypothetical protein